MESDGEVSLFLDLQGSWFVFVISVRWSVSTSYPSIGAAWNTPSGCSFSLDGLTNILSPETAGIYVPEDCHKRYHHPIRLMNQIFRLFFKRCLVILNFHAAPLFLFSASDVLL